MKFRFFYHLLKQQNKKQKWTRKKNRKNRKNRKFQTWKCVCNNIENIYHRYHHCHHHHYHYHHYYYHWQYDYCYCCCYSVEFSCQKQRKQGHLRCWVWEKIKKKTHSGNIRKESLERILKLQTRVKFIGTLLANYIVALYLK